MNRHQLEPCRRIAAALATALLLVHGAARAEEGKSAITACDASISACGCTITKSGTYTLTANLSSTQGLTATGDCIDIKASNVILNGHNFNIIGPASNLTSGIASHGRKAVRHLTAGLRPGSLPIFQHRPDLL
jgi:hypothetical protein